MYFPNFPGPHNLHKSGISITCRAQGFQPRGERELPATPSQERWMLKTREAVNVLKGIEERCQGSDVWLKDRDKRIEKGAGAELAPPGIPA